MEANQTYFKAFKFRLNPEEDQIELLMKHFGCTRFIFNRFLEEKQRHYKDNGTTLNYNNCSGILTALKKQEEYEWLSEVNSQCLQTTLKNLETAFGRFFKKQSKFPKFKSKKVNKDTFCCPQNVSVEGSKIFIPKFKKGISFIKHREIKGEIRSATFSKVPSGELPND